MSSTVSMATRAVGHVNKKRGSKERPHWKTTTTTRREELLIKEVIRNDKLERLSFHHELKYGFL